MRAIVRDSGSFGSAWYHIGPIRFINFADMVSVGAVWCTASKVTIHQESN
jgi:hypothetical protein